MFSSLLLFCVLAFAETKTLALQICLDREGYSCNAIDGQWGAKSQRALEAYCTAHGKEIPATPEEALDRFFPQGDDRLFRIESVTQADLDALVTMPDDPAEKAKLAKMGYASVLEMFAERGHLTRRAMERMNPGVVWTNVIAGTKLVIPDFPTIEENLKAWPRKRNSKLPEAALVRISLSQFTVSAYDASGKPLAVYPCSIARDKNKLPPHGELKITTPIANPNYTYSPDYVPKGKKAQKHIFPDGPRCPVGVAWLGLNLPGYGIHGTPKPESIGRAESHGCFRLSNWNAARLYALCPPGTKVLIEP